MRPLLPTIGTDIVRLARFARPLSPAHARPSSASPRSYAERFLRKVFSARELGALDGRVDGGEGGVRFVASRWAAKEAVIKAFRHRRLLLAHVEIYSEPGRGVFALVLPPDAIAAAAADGSGGADAAAAGETGGSRGDVRTGPGGGERMGLRGCRADMAGEEARGGVLVDVSISHEDEYCVAVALAPPPPA